MSEGTAPKRRRLSRRQRRLLFIVALSIGLPVVGLVILELCLRAFTGSILGPVAEIHGMFELAADGTVQTTPGWRGQQTVEGVTTVRMNNLGMRGRDIGAKRDGEVRVLVLGDSFVWGYGVGDDDTFAAVLERSLNDAGGATFTVGNAGAPGYGTRDYVGVLRRYRASFDPDLVLVCIYSGNDFTDDARLYETVISGYRLLGPMARLAASSARARRALRFRTAMLIERWLDEHWPSMAIDRSLLAQRTPEEIAAEAHLPADPAERAGGLFAEVRAATDGTRKVFSICQESLEQIRDLAAPAPVFAVVIPTWWHMSEREYSTQLERIGFDPADFERGLVGARLVAAATAAGIESLDLFPLLVAEPDPIASWQPVGKHFSVEGHARVAAWLLPIVRRLVGR